MDTVRCSVVCLADFGDLLSAKVIRNGTEVFLSTGGNDVLVFSIKEKRVKIILHFYSSVTSLALSDDGSRLYALCENDGLYCIPMALESSSNSLSAKCHIPALHTVPRDSAVIKDGKVQSFLVVEGILVTVSIQESFWTINLYEATNCVEGNVVYHQHAGFQVPSNMQVPVAAKIPQTVNAEDSRTRASTLACIYPSSVGASKRPAQQGHPVLEPLLFRLLFGVDASLAHSPVILCGLPDGRIFFFPLLLPVLISSRGEQKTQIRMFHSLEQPVTFIGTSVTGEKGPQCLVVVGQKGRILIARANQGGSDGKMADCSFTEHTVRGPVECACVDGERLYYSTSTNLQAVSLNNTPEPPSPPAVSSKSSICFGVCRVTALTELCITPAGCVELLAVSLSGKLLQVTVPQASDKESLYRLSSSQVGQRVQDLLSGIENVWERASSVKHQLQLRNNTLKCLNHVFSVCHLLLNCHKNDQEICDRKPPISCRAVANWSTLLQKDSLILTCILENLSDCALEQGWTLCVEVQSSRSADSSSTTYSFALKKVDCGQKLEVTLPLDIDGEVFLPVWINCYLVYSLPSLVYLKELRHFSAFSDIPISQLLRDDSRIRLALNTLTLDWLDCLRTGSLPNTHGDIPKQITAWETIHVFLNSRQTHTEPQSMSKPGPHTVAVRISSELLRAGLGLHGCSGAVLCTSVLKWLVSGAPEVGGRQPEQSPVVCVIGPGRHAIRLLTKEVILSDINTEGPLSAVEVLVESFSMEALCGLHHAVLRRVQALLKEVPVALRGPGRLRGQHLSEAVQHVESLYKDLQDSRTPDAFGGVMKMRKTSELFKLYLQLRQKPLVIL